MSGRRNQSMQIGQISKQAGISIDAIRFYERSGLLAAPPRSEGGFRLYSSSDLSTLLFIRNLQTLGFSLNEIREFLSLRSDDLRACFEVRKMLDHKLRDIHVKRIALGKLEAELKDTLAKCDSQRRRLRGKQNGRCPVLTAYKGSKHEGAA
jgi:MerR family transcriptional regulator, mercuric resistance operon regulatory protein